jgi:hypothetical protein
VYPPDWSCRSEDSRPVTSDGSSTKHWIAGRNPSSTRYSKKRRSAVTLWIRVAFARPLLQRLSGGEVGEFFAGIQDSRNTDEMTLFAYALACGGLQISGIDNISWRRFGEVCGERSMASIAAHCKMRERDGCVSVLRSFDCVKRSGVAEHTARRDWASEVRICRSRVLRSLRWHPSLRWRSSGPGRRRSRFWPR